MLFNSFDFGLFLPVVFILYWLIGNNRIKLQNALILVASYFFYGIWDWRFLMIILLSSLLDFYVAKAMSKTPSYSKRRGYLFFSLGWNLGVLFIFKYFNFFLDNLKTLFEIPENSWTTLNIIVPLGLSFYTFQTLSYTIDVFKKKIPASNTLLDFLCYVSFFPQLVAGPIERAGRLLPQFGRKRVFNTDEAKDGLRLILWGLFKKVVVADNLAIIVGVLFATPEEFSSFEIFFGGVLFFFQLYCDFSGYSEIAIGTAKLFGFKLSINFKLPFLAKSISDLWNRWHITLSTWFRDYVYIEYLLPRSRTLLQKAIGLLLTMVLIGLWHGAAWTFVIFGIIHGALLVIETIPLTIKGKRTRIRQWLYKNPWISRFYVFFFIVFTMLFFRAASIGDSWELVSGLFTRINFNFHNQLINVKLVFLLLMLIAEISLRRQIHPLQFFDKKVPLLLRWATYYIVILIILRYGGPQDEFIYFQF